MDTANLEAITVDFASALYWPERGTDHTGSQDYSALGRPHSAAVIPSSVRARNVERDLLLSLPVAILLSAATVVRFQVVTAAVSAFGNIACSVYLTRRIGVPGVVFGSIISQVLLVLIPYLLYIRGFMLSLSRLERRICQQGPE